MMARVLLLIVLAISALVGGSHAADFYVDSLGGTDDAGCGGLGDECATWSFLITQATPGAGDTVYFVNSTGSVELNEQVIVPLANAGAAGNPLTLSGLPSGQTTPGIIDGDGATIGATEGLIWVQADADYIHIENLEVRDSGDHECVLVQSKGVEMDNLEVHGCGGPTDGSGIIFGSEAEPTFNIVRNSEVYDTFRSGIICFQVPGGHMLFENNKVHDTGGDSNFDGIQWNDCPNMIVQDNEIYSVGADGDLIDGGGNLAAPAHHAVIQRNLVYRGPTVTDSKGFRSNNKPYRWIIRHNTTDYVRMEFYEPDDGTNPGQFKVYNNTIIRAGLDNPGSGNALRWWSGDGAFASAGVEAKNNAFILSTNYLIEFQPLNEDGSYPIIKMDGNAYAFSTFGILWHDAGGSNEYAGDAAGYALWRSEQGQEPGGGVLTTQSLAQLFVDVEGRNFSPKPGSDLIDAGTDLTTTSSTGTGTDVPVVDSSYFTDGYGLINGDLVKIGSNLPVRIVSINEGTHVLTLESSISWTTGDAVNLPFSGAAPDIGAVEFARRRRGRNTQWK